MLELRFPDNLVYKGRSWEELEAAWRNDPWNAATTHGDKLAFRQDVAQRAGDGTRPAFSIRGSSQDFLTRCAQAGMCQIVSPGRTIGRLPVAA